MWSGATGAYICLSHLLNLGVDGGEELDRVARLVGLDEVRPEVQLPLGDVVIKLEQISVPQLENPIINDTRGGG